MRRIWLLVLLVLGGAIPAFGQSTTVSGTITDTGSQAWFSGSVQFTFRPTDSNPTAQYFWNGVPFDKNTTIPQNPLVLDGSGAFSGVSVPSNSSIAPANSTWTVKVCPAASTPCFSKNLTITGTTLDISSQIIPPAITLDLTVPLLAARAYLDGEITGAIPGTQYFNVTDNKIHVCLLTGFPPCTWFPIGGGTVTSFSAGNLSPLFTTAVANPTTTPALSFAADAVAANLVLAGPVTGSIDSGSTSTSGHGTVVSVTGTPTNAPEAVVFIGNYAFASGGGAFPSPSVPASGWTTIDTPGTAGIFLNSAATTSPFTASSTLGFTSDWTASLLLLGISGSVSLAQSPLSLCSGSVGNNTCGPTAFTNPVGAGHAIMVLVNSGDASGTTSCSATDTLLNSYVTVINDSSASTRQIVLIANGSAAGSDSVTVHCATSGGGLFAGSISAYEFAGITSVTGAYSFRHLVGADLPLPALSSLGGVEAYTSPTHQFVTAINVDGSVSSAQPTAGDISGGVVTAVNGTANQIDSSGGSTPTLSTPSTFIAPGSIKATTSLTIGGISTGNCLQTTTGGLVQGTGSPCPNFSGITQVQTANNTSICTTGSGSFDSCPNTVTWPLAFADNSYNVSCSGVGPVDSANPTPARANIQIISHTTTSVSVAAVTLGAAAITWGEIDCIGVHP